MIELSKTQPNSEDVNSNLNFKKDKKMKVLVKQSCLEMLEVNVSTYIMNCSQLMIRNQNERI